VPSSSKYPQKLAAKGYGNDAAYEYNGIGNYNKKKNIQSNSIHYTHESSPLTSAGQEAKETDTAVP
jgi:hypothetical protein